MNSITVVGSANSYQHGNKAIDIFDVNETLKYPRLFQFLNCSAFQIVQILFTIYALFGDDIRVITTNKVSYLPSTSLLTVLPPPSQYADSLFDMLSIACITVFFSQIVLQVICEPEYRNSFFFWLEIVSTLTILLDIQLFTSVILFKNNFKSTLQLSRASRASRIGTK